MCETLVKHLSTSEIAAAMGVGESSVKRWIDAGTLSAEKTPGGHRRVTVSSLYDFLLATGRKLVAPEAVGLQGPAEFPVAAIEVCQTSLRGGDVSTFESALQMLRLAEMTPATVIDKFVYPAFQALRATCQHPSEECLVLHRAIVVLQAALSKTLAPVGVAPGDASPRIVLADVGYEVDGIPSMLAEAAVWDQARCLQLGTNVPATVIEGALETFDADVLWLSASGPARRSAVSSDFHRIEARASRAKVKVVTFGSALPRMRGETETRVSSFGEFRGFVAAIGR